MLNVKKLQALRDKILGVVANPNTYGDLNSVVYLQQILDAVKGTDPLNIRGNLAEHIYLQKILNAKRGVVDGQFGSLPNSIYLQQLINAYNGVADGQFGSLSENSYLDALVAVATSGAAPIFTYLLRDEFTTAEAAPLTSPRTCEPGPGTLKIVDTGNNASITGGYMLVAASVGNGNPGIWDVARTRAAGLAVIAKHRTANGGGYVGFDTDQAGNLLETATSFTTTVNAYVGGVIVVGCDIDPRNKDLDVGTVLRTVGSFHVVKWPTDSVWKLMWVASTGNTATIYPAFDLAAVTVASKLYRFAVAQFTSVVNSDAAFQTSKTASAGVGATATMEADGLVEATWQAATGATYELDVRRTDDDNRWIIRCDQGGSTIKIIERNATVETERASAAQTWTNGTSYRIVVICDTQSIKTFVANAAKASYATAAFNQTATGVKTSHAVTNLITWRRYLSGAITSSLDSV